MDNSKFIDQINNDGYAVIPNLISAADCDFYISRRTRLS